MIKNEQGFLKKSCDWHKWNPEETLNLKQPINFCFHVYAQKSLFIGENVNVFNIYDLLLHTRACDIRVHRAGSQPKIKKKIY